MMAKEYRVLSEAASRDEKVINGLAADGYVLDFVAPNCIYFVRESSVNRASTPSFALNGQPEDGDTFVVGIGKNPVNYVYTYKTRFTDPSIPGEVLIGDNQWHSTENMYAALTGGDESGRDYSAGTTAVPESAVVVSAPTATDDITFSIVGEAGPDNTLTLSVAKNASGNLMVANPTPNRSDYFSGSGSTNRAFSGNQTEKKTSKKSM